MIEQNCQPLKLSCFISHFCQKIATYLVCFYVMWVIRPWFERDWKSQTVPLTIDLWNCLSTTTFSLMLCLSFHWILFKNIFFPNQRMYQHKIYLQTLTFARQNYQNLLVNDNLIIFLFLYKEIPRINVIFTILKSKPF